MYAGEHLIDAVDVSVVGQSRLQRQMIEDIMQQLLQKHKKDLSSAEQDPSFFLESVPSLINNFQSLRDKYLI